MDKCCELLFQMMKDLVKNAEDVVWLTDIETVFDRLVDIYQTCGGDMNILHKEFPDYPICDPANTETLIFDEVISIDPGDTVLCDWCNKDWTAIDISGGFMFESKATCPECAPSMEKKIAQYNETHLIKSRCPADMSFADWIRDVIR